MSIKKEQESISFKKYISQSIVWIISLEEPCFRQIHPRAKAMLAWLKLLHPKPPLRTKKILNLSSLMSKFWQRLIHRTRPRFARPENKRARSSLIKLLKTILITSLCLTISSTTLQWDYQVLIIKRVSQLMTPLKMIWSSSRIKHLILLRKSIVCKRKRKSE